MRHSPIAHRWWKGKNVLITGASSGIGAALAADLAGRGARVALVARRADRLEALARSIASETMDDCSAVFSAADVTSSKDLTSAVALLRTKLGQFDCVIANAGFDQSGSFTDLTVDDYRHQLETNVFGVMNTVYATADDLKSSKGILAIVGSVAGYLSPPGHSAYSMSKHAVRSLADALRIEWRHLGVGVVHLNTGFVATEIRNNWTGSSGADPIPTWLSIEPERAAAEMVRGIARRRSMVNIGLSAKIALRIQGVFPWLMRLGLRLSYRRALLYLYAFFFLKTCISIIGFSYSHLESTNDAITLLIRIAAFISFQLFVSQFFIFTQLITKAPEDAKPNLRTKRVVIAYNVEQLVVFGIWLFLEGGTGSFSIARTIVTVVSYAFLLLTCVRLVTRRRFVASDRFRGTIIPIAVVMLALLPVSFALDLHVSLVLRLTTFSDATFPFVLFPLNFLLPILVILAQGIRQLHVLNHPRNAQIVANPLTNFGVSSREFEVIKLIREGHSNKEIAQRMGISPATVRNHVHNIFEKTAVKTREELRAFLEQQTIQT